MSKGIRLVRLLPDILRLNGSLGNAEVLRVRLEWWGIPVEVIDTPQGGTLPGSADVIVMGHGTSSMASRAWGSLSPLGQQLVSLHRGGAAVVGIGLGGDLLGESIQFGPGHDPREGIGLTDIQVDLSGKRFSGEVLGTSWRGDSVAGYLNDGVRRSSTRAQALVNSLEPRLGSWQGATAQNSEGVVAEGLWVSALSGPLFALNPVIADCVIETVLSRHGRELPNPTEQHRMVDDAANRARAAIEHRIAHKR